MDKARVLVIAAPYYKDIVDGLMAGAMAVFEADGRVEVERIDVPGVFEIPAALNWMAQKREHGGFLTLGCVIRGETSHYDHICQSASDALMNLSVAGAALGFGVLTVENMDQAKARADVNQKDKGGEAARACLRMMELQGAFV